MWFYGLMCGVFWRKSLPIKVVITFLCNIIIYEAGKRTKKIVSTFKPEFYLFARMSGVGTICLIILFMPPIYLLIIPTCDIPSYLETKKSLLNLSGLLLMDGRLSKNFLKYFSRPNIWINMNMKNLRGKTLIKMLRKHECRKFIPK